MKKLAYWQKLQDPRWQKKRLEVFERDGFKCRSCCSGTDTLNVHHLYYVSKRDPWDYPLGAFKTLCKDCHEKYTTGEYSDSWENLVAWNNEADLKAGGVDLASSLLHCAKKNSMTPADFICLLCETMGEGLIASQTISDWIDGIKLSHGVHTENGKLLHVIQNQ